MAGKSSAGRGGAGGGKHRRLNGSSSVGSHAWRRALVQRIKESASQPERAALPIGTAAACIGTCTVAWLTLTHTVERQLNGRVLPFASEELSASSRRNLRPGRLRIRTPLCVELQELSIGMQRSRDNSCLTERSTADAPRVVLLLHPVESALNRMLVISVRADNLKLTLRQGRNRSWFGFPDDTHPHSSRPGLLFPSADSAAFRSVNQSEQQQHLPTKHQKQAQRKRLHVKCVRLHNACINAVVYGDPETRVFFPVNGTITLPYDSARHEHQSAHAAAHASSSSFATTQNEPAYKQSWRIGGIPAGEPHIALTGTARHRSRQHMQWTFNHPRAACSLRQHELEGEARAREEADKKAAQLDAAGTISVNGVPSNVTVSASFLEAQLLERLLDIPLDIRGGTVDGSLTAQMVQHEQAASDDETARNGNNIPHLNGLFKLHEASAHVFDAPDTFHTANGWVSLDGNQVSILHTHTMYGAIPLAASGAIDISSRPADGRLSLSVRTRAPVAVKDARETLGVRPTPRPLEGDAEGEVLIGGSPLKPLIVGYARAVRRGSSADRILKRSHEALGWAAEAMLREPSAVAAYDRVPFSTARAAFSVDPQGGAFRLHEAQIVPVASTSQRPTEQVFGAENKVSKSSSTPGGGPGLSMRGRVRIKPDQTQLDDCIDMDFSGSGLLISQLSAPYEAAFAGRELPSECRELLLGDDEQKATLAIRGTMRGPQLAPRINLSIFDALEGNLSLSREGIAGKVCGSGGTSASWQVDTSFPPAERAANAVTERQAMMAASPSVDHIRVSLNLPNTLLNRVVPLRALPPLKLSAGCSIEGTPSPNGFEGKITLDRTEGIKLNSLELAPHGASGVVRGGEVAVQSKDGGGVWLQRASVVRNAGVRLICGDLNASAELLAGGGIKAMIRNLELDKLELASMRGLLTAADAHVSASGGAIDAKILSPRAAGLAGDSVRAKASFSSSTGDVSLHALEAVCNESVYSVSGETRARKPANAKVSLHSAKLEHLTAAYALVAELAELMLQGGRNNKDTARTRFADSTKQCSLRTHGATLLDQIASFEDSNAFAFGRGDSSSNSNSIGSNARGRVPPSPAGRELQSSLSAAASKGRTWNSKSGFVQRMHDERMSGSNFDAAASAIANGDEQQGSASMGQRKSVSGSIKQTTRATRSMPAALSGTTDGVIEATFGPEYAAGSDGDGAIQQFLLPREVTFDISISSVSLPVLSERAGTIGGMAKGKLVYTSAVAPLLELDRLGIHQDDKEHGEGSIELSGTLGGEQQNASFHAVDVPAGALAASVNGSLYAQGRIHGSASDPTGLTRIRLVDGAVGGARLAHAEATANLIGERRASVSAVAAPAAADGHIHCECEVPLLPLAHFKTNGQELGTDERVRGKFRARGSGVPAIVQAVGPSGLAWEGGSADADGSIDGTLSAPNADVRVSMHRALLAWPQVLGPSQRASVSTHARLKDGIVHIDSLDARVGRRGTVKARGTLPLQQRKRSSSSSASTPSSWRELVAKAENAEGLRLDASALEIRSRGSLSARVDAGLQLSGSVEQPDASGSISVSHGSFVVPTAAASSGGRHENSSDSDSKGTSAAVKRLKLSGLDLKLGPDMRLSVPLLLNLAVDGSVRFTGETPDRLLPSGTISMPYGDANLIATGARLDRDYHNTATFDAEGGIGNPSLDLCLLSDGTVALIRGRVAHWRDSVTVIGGGPMLKPTVVQPDGRLAIAALASRTLEHLLPRLETRGRLGMARWRVSGSPSLHALSLGTELEIRIGEKLVATLDRRSGLAQSKASTHWSLTYLFSPRLSFSVDSVLPLPPRALFQFSSSDEAASRNYDRFRHKHQPRRQSAQQQQHNDLEQQQRK